MYTVHCTLCHSSTLYTITRQHIPNDMPDLHAYPRTYTNTHTSTHSHTHPYIPTHTYTHTHIPTLTHTHTHILTHTHTHTHTYPHTLMLQYTCPYAFHVDSIEECIPGTHSLYYGLLFINNVNFYYITIIST